MPRHGLKRDGSEVVSSHGMPVDVVSKIGVF